MMLKLSTYGTVTTYLNLRYKRFKDEKGKIYRGDETVLIADKNNIFSNITKESYNKFYKNHKDKLVMVTEVTSWRKKIGNLKISGRSGIHKQRWTSHKKLGQASSTTMKNHGSVQTVNVL